MIAEALASVALLSGLAALFGAGSITVAEYLFFRALSDGRIDDGERAHLSGLFFALRFAAVLLLLSDLVLAFLLHSAGGVEIATTSAYWTRMTVIVLLVHVAWLKVRARIPFWAASAVSFTGWWYLAFTALGIIPVLSFGASMALLIVSCGIIAAVFAYLRLLASPQNMRTSKRFF